MIGELLPDQPALDNPGLLQAGNLIRYAGAYRPVRNFVAETNALSNPCLGAAVLINAAGAVYNYAGDATKAYTRSGDTYTSVSTGHSAVRWEFSRFYDTVVAVNGGDAVLTGTFGGALSGAASSPTGANTLTVARNYAIVGNDSVDAAAVSWSALGAPANWTTGETGSQHLDGAGAVVKLIGGEYVTVLCQRGIYRMLYLGADPWWQFDQVESERGALYQGMVANVGNLVYYLDSAGFYVFDGTGSRPISSTRITQTFFDDLDRDNAAACSSIADTEAGQIIFAYPGSGNTGLANKQLVYNYVEDCWSGPIERTVQRLVYTLIAATTSDSIGTACDTAPYTTLYCDDSSLLGSNDPQVGAFLSSNKMGRDTGSILPATIETGDYEFNGGGSAYCGGFRPIVDGETTGITGAVDYRQMMGAAVTRGTLVAANTRTGAIDQRQDARYHRFRLSVSGEFTSISGIEPILADNST